MVRLAMSDRRNLEATDLLALHERVPGTFYLNKLARHVLRPPQEQVRDA